MSCSIWLTMHLIRNSEIIIKTNCQNATIEKFVLSFHCLVKADFSLEIAPIIRVMAIKAKGSANYGPPCSISIARFIENTSKKITVLFWKRDSNSCNIDNE